MKKVLVAGATGYLGRFIVRELKRKGFHTKILLRNEIKAETPGNFDAPSILKYADEIVVGEITESNTLIGICKDIDYVFTSVGITRQKDKVSFHDVDFQGNLNLLKEAERSQVEKFMYIHVLTDDQGEELGPLIEAKARFVDELVRSPISHIVIRPSGFFSDMTAFFNMAKNGRVYLPGKGANQINPIHGSDLAAVCVQSFQENNLILDAGGPDVFTFQQVAELAFDVLGKKRKILHIPDFLLKQTLLVIKLVNRHYYGLAKFMINASTKDAVGTAYGNYKLKDYLRDVSKYY